MTFVFVEIVQRETTTYLESESGEEHCSTHKRHIRHRSVHDYGTDRKLSTNSLEKSQLHCENDVLGISPVNDRFRETFGYRKYRLGDKSSHYDDEAARSVTK